MKHLRNFSKITCIAVSLLAVAAAPGVVSTPVTVTAKALIMSAYGVMFVTSGLLLLQKNPPVPHTETKILLILAILALIIQMRLPHGI